ncbi:type I restriction-modification system subunit M [Porphyromonas gingivalis]|uniref:site-specific DNA-methyltransferase (adenine-specific) n=1 Tax=Porphyromonas gingivalis F0570 TaxID=1227271 RepID=A0A0E2LPW7_PORGN|nr:type I restriction-modification system subunit M [Porphyromonas gingivalis]ERJ65608.1 type I restriction-modification system, M subunit [Porphyromonas gingivalis F0570]
MTVLGKTLWAIADELRGTMNADDFRDYMLSFLFLRYLSDNYEEVARRELGRDYPDETNLNQGETALQRWYTLNSEDIVEFEAQMRRKIHYVIKPEYLWSHIAELARTQSSELLNILNEGFRYIENESFERTFSGLFSEVNLSSEKLGKTYSQKNTKLATIIQKIAEGIGGFSSEVDALGDAYEYLIEQFAAGSGKKAGEFYTPQAISTILSRIVSLDAQNPERGMKDGIKRVLDFACGSGSLLLNVRKQMGDRIGRIYGQELNVTTYNLARMNMILHGVKDTEFEIFHGDSLTNEWPFLNNPNPTNKVEFDAIVANPPFSLKWAPKEETAQDFRFQNYGVAPKSAADFAFLLHGLHYLSKDGTMAIILPHGVLFRGGAERAIRKKLLEDGYIDTIIGLPSKLFYSTGIPVCIIVLKKCRTADDVLFIDASRNFAKDKKQNRLRMGQNGEPNDIDKIIDAYQYRREINKYARRVTLDEIRANEYNLNIPRYVDTFEEEEEIDIQAVMGKIEELEARRTDLDSQINVYLRELGLIQ